MNPKYRRLFIITVIILTIAVATQLVLIALRDNIVYFYTPNELKNKYADSKNIERVSQGQPPINLIDFSRGY